MTLRPFARGVAAAILVTGCAAASPTTPVDDPSAPPVATSDAAPDAAPRAPLSAEDACWARYVNYCPDEGPTTCTTKDGVKTIPTCSSMGGHCVGADHCVKGPAAVCDAAIPENGGTCTASTSCTWMSRMGVAQCDCTSGHWKCSSAGI